MAAVKSKPKPEVPEADRPLIAVIAQQQADAPAPKKIEPLIDLDDIAPERPTIRYKGTLVEMRDIDDFGIEDHQRLNRDGAEFFELYSSTKELSKTESQRLRMLLERLYSKVCPDELADAGLSDAQKAQVILGFRLAPLARRMAQDEQAQKMEMDRADPEAGDSDPITGS
jgi:hypothetical protein